MENRERVEEELQEEEIELEEEEECEEEGEASSISSGFVEHFASAVKNLLELLSSGRKLREPYTIRVTEAISCLRKSYLNIVHGVEKDNLYMSIGRYMHMKAIEVLREELSKIGQVDVEPRITEPIFPDATSVVYRLWNLLAEPDLVVRTYDGKIHVIELKFTFTNRLGTENVLRYRMQVGTYVKMLNADAGHVLVIKNSLEVKHIVVTRREAEEYHRKVMERARKLAKAIIEENIPEPEQGIDCKTCPHKTFCNFRIGTASS